MTTVTDREIGAALATAAIDALTRIAQRSRPLCRHAWPDFAGVLADVLATVAANVGGVGELLAGRSGSWEADLVQQLVRGTVGDDDADLLRRRTAPIQLRIEAEDVFADLGLRQLWEDEYSDVDDAGARLDVALSADQPTLNAAQVAAAEAEQKLLYAVAEQIDLLWQTDLDTYAAAYEDVVRQQLAAWGRPDLPVVVDRLHTYDPSWMDHGGPLAGRLHEIARTRTPLPATGAAPDWAYGGTPAALRAAGRGYRARAEQAVAAAEQPGA